MTARLAAQHAGHQMPGQAASAQAPSPELVTACVQAQQQASRIADRAQARLDAARQTNSPEDMRAAVDDLQAALGQIRSGLAQCQPLTAVADPPAGHAMPNMPQTPSPAAGTPMMKPGSSTPAPAAVAPMDHSKMPMGGAPAGKRGAATGAKPPPPAAPMDHSKMPMGGDAKQGKVMDPVNGLMVDPMTAPKTTYQGQTYYFSSEETRKEFMQTPAKFAKKPKQ